MSKEIKMRRVCICTWDRGLSKKEHITHRENSAGERTIDLYDIDVSAQV